LDGWGVLIVDVGRDNEEDKKWRLVEFESVWFFYACLHERGSISTMSKCVFFITFFFTF